MKAIDKNERNQKPSVEEWLHWAGVVIDRLSNCVHVYKKPPHADVFVSDSERQKKTDITIKLLHRIHALADQSEVPSDSVSDAHEHYERTISGLTVLFGETLAALPWLSADMQKMLKSPWMSQFPNKLARIVFNGDGIEEQGIGSGHREQGRLPASLDLMLEREQGGDTRHPREELLRHGEPRRHDTDARERWAAQNSGFLRTAGRVE